MFLTFNYAVFTKINMQSAPFLWVDTALFISIPRNQFPIYILIVGRCYILLLINQTANICRLTLFIKFLDKKLVLGLTITRLQLKIENQTVRVYNFCFLAGAVLVIGVGLKKRLLTIQCKAVGEEPVYNAPFTSLQLNRITIKIRWLLMTNELMNVEAFKRLIVIRRKETIMSRFKVNASILLI